MEVKVNQLMESPFFSEYSERAALMGKVKGMEAEKIRDMNEMKNLRETMAKLETEIKLKKEEIE